MSVVWNKLGKYEEALKEMFRYHKPVRQKGPTPQNLVLMQDGPIVFYQHRTK